MNLPKPVLFKHVTMHASALVYDPAKVRPQCFDCWVSCTIIFNFALECRLCNGQDLIGRGSLGKVYKGTYGRHTVAIKEVRMSKWLADCRFHVFSPSDFAIFSLSLCVGGRSS